MLEGWVWLNHGCGWYIYFHIHQGGVISESSNTPSKHVQELGPKLFEGEFFGPIFLTHPARCHPNLDPRLKRVKPRHKDKQTHANFHVFFLQIKSWLNVNNLIFLDLTSHILILWRQTSNLSSDEPLQGGEYCQLLSELNWLRYVKTLKDPDMP